MTVILHTLNTSPGSAGFTDCLRVIAAGDALLLMGDGVYGAIADTAAGATLQASGAEIYVLTADTAAAGVSNLIKGANHVDMDGFVALTERFPRQQAWY
ncbi:MAG: sulfurtransferase complex subunit TusB [Gammaproteobacteria bacterium]|nr:MAG: sulfurtransferase complex subunit TusB [Gammaproteobacteria bacterium]